MRSCFCLLAVCSASLFAQSDRGTITGTVSDQGGSMMPNVAITATHLNTNTQFKTTTNSSGEFTLPSLPVGAYQVIIQITGFRTSQHDKVTLEAGSSARLDTKLEVGAVQQTVEVSAESSLLQADDAKVLNSISDRLIEGLPTVVSGNMRSPFDVAGITAGVNGGDQDFRIGGGQEGAFGVTLDGASGATNRAGSTLWAAVNAPSLEAITEFAVETNGFKAEFGRAGGGVITFVSKSGSNQYHGNAFDFIRNDAFDARGFFNLSVPVYRQHDFGGTVGGPIRIPKLYNGKNRTFFFASYEGFRNRVGGATSVAGLPPPEFYKGDFRNAVSRTRNADGTYLLYKVYDPSTTRFDPSISNYIRDPFPNNMIPESRIDPLARKISDLALSTFKPLRTDVVPGTPQYWLENYWQSGTSVNPNNKFSVKFDHVISDKHRVSAYIGYSRRESVPGPGGPSGIPGILNPFLTLSDTAPVYRGSLDSTISPRLHNRFYFGINLFHDSNYPLSEGGHWKDKICIPNVPDCDRNLPVITMGDFPVWGGNGFNGSENPVYSFNDDLTWTRGKHVLKTGYLFELAPYVGLGQQAGPGNVTFSTANTALPGQSNRNTGGGIGFASFLLGESNGATINTPRRVGMRWRYHAMYFQDDWRVTPRLSINLGIRYEFNLPALNGNDQCADFDPTLPNPGASGRLGALIFCGTGPGRAGRHSLTPGWYGGVGPRFGLSWAAARKMIVRLSGGSSFAPVKSVGGSAHFQGFAQILTFPDQTNGIEPVFKLSQGVPAWPKPPFIDPTFGNNGSVDWWQGQESNRLPQLWSGSFTIQREFRGRTMIEAGYSGIIGTHLIANLLNYDQTDISTLPSSLDIFTAAGRNLLNTTFANGNRLVQQAGFSKPYPEFPDNFTLARALTPYPQYSAIATSSGGDHSGHSSYHSMIVKVTRRYSAGLLVDASYVLSKMFTDSDSVWGSGAAVNQYNRRLEKALSAHDRTHDLKVNYVYELPVGPGKHYLKRGVLSQVIGGWRIGAVQRYASGFPMAFTGAFAFPIIGNRPYITQYDDWRAPTKGDKFDPFVDRYFKTPTTANFSGDKATITSQGWFPLQPHDQVGNMTRTNPKMRNFPLYNENVSLAKTFTISQEHRRTVDLRFEGFNVLNRTQFGFGNPNGSNVNLNDAANLGLVRAQANSPRAMQFAAKLNW
jgi:hypothetical protein